MERARRKLSMGARLLEIEPRIDNNSWLRRLLLVLPDKKELEVVDTYDESMVIPFTADGKIVLVKRNAPALGRSIITALSAANHDHKPHKEIAMRAFRKLHIQGAEEVNTVFLGDANPWKYLTSTTHNFFVKLPVDSGNLAGRTSIVDDKTEGFDTFSEQEFFTAIDNGDITDLRTIVAFQFALAAKNRQQNTHDLMPGDSSLLALLEPTQLLEKRYIPGSVEKKDWFPRVHKHGDETIQNPSDQAQVIGVIERADGSKSVVFLAEPFYAQGKINLTLPSGGIEKGLTAEETTVHEIKEETGYEIDKESVSRVTNPRHPLPLYIRVTSSVFAAKVTKKGIATGGDESAAEKGVGVEVPVEQIGLLIRNGFITDMSTIAGLLDWGRKNNIKIL